MVTIVGQKRLPSPGVEMVEPRWNLWKVPKFQKVEAPWWSQRKHYFRKTPFTYNEPTDRQLRQRGIFASAASRAFNLRGLKRGMPVATNEVRREFTSARAYEVRLLKAIEHEFEIREKMRKEMEITLSIQQSFQT